MSKTLIKDAIVFAIKAHDGQCDDGGHDYFMSHCWQVYKIIEIISPTDFALQAAALLHDTIEDTAVTYDNVREKFGTEIANLVHEVTHERKTDNTGWYFPRLTTIRGILLKFADRTSNLSRMEGAWDEKRIAKYIKKSKFWKTEDDSDQHGI